MAFNRKLYNQKPSAWGPVSAVQASIFKNAERVGIDPRIFTVVSPFWEKAGGAVYNYIDIGQSGVITTATWGVHGVQFNAADDRLRYPPVLSQSEGFLFLEIVRFATRAQYSTWLNIENLSNNSPHEMTLQCFNSNYLTFKPNGDQSSSNLWDYGTYTDVMPINTATFIAASWKNTVGIAGYVNGKVTGAEAGYSNWIAADWTASELIGIGNTPDNTNEIAYSNSHIGLFVCGNSELPADKHAYLSDNPYFLLQRVAPVFYSVPGGAGGVTISSTTGTVVVIGYDVGIETGVTISVNTGTITGTGFNVEVEQGTSVKATTGEISINGLNSDIVQGTQFIVTKEMVAINGFDTTVLNGTEINVTSKNVSITGYVVEVEQGIIITSSIESIIVTGYNVSVTNELVISLNVGNVIIAGYNTTVLAGTRIDLTKVEITITGLDLEIEQGTQIDVTSETVTVTGLDVSVENALSINVTTGSVNVLGYPVNVYAGILVESITGNVAITGYNPTVAQSSGVEVTTGQVTITGLDITIECTVLIEPTTGMVIIASYAVTVTDGLIAETPITRTNVVAASNRVITNSGSSRLMTNSNNSRLIVIT